MTANKTRPVQATAPKRIYLQGWPQLPKNIDFSSLSEVTWCRDNVDGTGIPYVRADLAGAAPAAVAPVLDVTLDEEQAGLLRDMLGDPAEYEEALTVRLIVCDGHSGHGLYVAQAEYQDEGAALLAPLPAQAAPAMEAPAHQCCNSWFLSLPEGRQAVLRDNQWMLADAAYEAGRSASHALEAPAAPVTLMTEDQASRWAWDQIREEVGTKGWTAGDSSNFFGFFLHGWNYRGQYELQRPAALLARAALAAAPQAPAAPVLVGDGQADAYLADPGRLETLARSHPAGLVRALARAAMAAPAAPAEGEVLVEVIGLTGSGKSAICGEIEILCRALGLDVSWPDGDPEKNMTHAEWTAAIEAYKPRVRIVERNVPRQSNGGPAK